MPAMQGTSTQLVSSSATITPELRRQIANLVGGEGKKAAGEIATASPAHPGPATLKKHGVAGVQIPSTITHACYVGKERAEMRLLQVGAGVGPAPKAERQLPRPRERTLRQPTRGTAFPRMAGRL